MSANTDSQKIKELLERGVENIYPSKEFLEEQLKSGKQLTLYTGYDPTAPTLHIGHGITMLKLKQFQELGHKIIFLIGDFTALIGDPTDKTSARVKQTRDEVLENCKLYKSQAEKILNFEGDNPVEVKYNSDWLAKLNFEDVMELSGHFTVHQMLQRDMFQKRIEEEKPIYMHEFFYPLMQGYDSVAMDVDGEVGGNDQTFNMLAGRTLLKDIKNKEKFVLAIKLLADNSGKKMSKTAGNMIAFSDAPSDMFGKVMKWSDEMIVNGLELCTTLSMEEIQKIAKKLEAGENPRDAKFLLAYEVTKIFLGVDAAEEGKKNFETVIQNKQKPKDIKELLPSSMDIITVLMEADFVTSKSDARRAIEGGGVRVNDEKIISIETNVSSGDIIQKGKRFFVRIS